MENIIKKYKYNAGIRTYSNKHYLTTGGTIHRTINDNKDVQEKHNAVNIVIERYNDISTLHKDDIVVLEKTLGRYQIAISKVITCFHNPKCDFDYTAEQVQSLIDDIYKFDEEISIIKMRLGCQD